MPNRKEVTLEEAKLIGESLYLDWNQVDLEQFRRGLTVKPRRANLGRQKRSGYHGVLLAGRTVMVHMQQFPDYLIRLARLRAETKAHAAQQDKPLRRSLP